MNVEIGVGNLSSANVLSNLKLPDFNKFNWHLDHVIYLNDSILYGEVIAHILIEVKISV